MTFQEILEGITRHRAHPITMNVPSGEVIPGELERKINEIEWALQALAEKMVENDFDRER